MNAQHPTTDLRTKTMAKALLRVFGEAELDRIARDVGLMQRKRSVAPLALLTACLSTLGVGKAQWLADILRTFNRFTGQAVCYKPFHRQLAKPGFAEFLRAVVNRALGELTIRVLEPLKDSRIAMFDDLLIHDGSSFALKEELAATWPGRFWNRAPAAMEVHATMSATQDNVVNITIAPDKEAERPFLPSGDELKNRLLLADRGYEGRHVFRAIEESGGSFIVRGNVTIKPTIIRAYLHGRRFKRIEGKPLDLKRLPRDEFDLDIDWGTGKARWDGRLIILGATGGRTKRQRVLLHTNLSRRAFRWNDVAALYRLRWQIELVFKEWKSYANLHKFDTSKEPIAEGLVWASLLVAILKRHLCNAAQRVTGIELSTQRAANSARHFLDDIRRALLVGRNALLLALEIAFTFLRVNARRAHPARDRLRGRLAPGLRPVHARD